MALMRAIGNEDGIYAPKGSTVFWCWKYATDLYEIDGKTTIEAEEKEIKCSIVKHQEYKKFKNMPVCINCSGKTIEELEKDRNTSRSLFPAPRTITRTTK